MAGIRFDRRAFLAAAVAAPVAALLPGCSRSEAGRAPTPPDLSGADAGVRVQDDLYRHVNGTWLREYQLPADKVIYGTGMEVDDRVGDQLRAIIDDIQDPEPGSDEQRLRDLYDAALDRDTRERLGLRPIQDLLADIASARTKSDLARVMGAITVTLPHNGGVLAPCGLFAVLVLPDQRDSRTYGVRLGQAGIALPAGVYQQSEFAAQLDAYREFLRRLAAHAGLENPDLAARRAADLEVRIVAEHWDAVRLRDDNATYNPYQWSELSTLAPGFDWNAWRDGLGAAAERFRTVVVGQPSYFTAAARLWDEVDIDDWRDYLRVGVVREFATLLDRTCVDLAFDFYGRVRHGRTEPATETKTALLVTESYLGELLSKQYVARHFSPEAKRAAAELVADIKAAHRDSLTAATWMSPQTRAIALAKLDRMTAKVGYPDTWQDYSGVTITKDELVTSVRAATRWAWAEMFARSGEGVRTWEWPAYAHTVEAYYRPNEIVLPAGILQPPFFDPGAESAVNFGGIGVTIGHEIGHAFDDQGARYDADGNLRDWWTAADRAEFDRRTQRVIAQFDGLTPVGMDSKYRVNGALTAGENAADIRGLAAALAAFRAAENRRGVTDPDYSYVFLAYARAWRRSYRPEWMIGQLASDPHCPTEFRVNQVVRNAPEFYTAFDVQDGDKLYLPPDQRVTL